MKEAVSTPLSDGFLTERQLLDRLHVCRRSLVSWRKSGKIPFIRLGTRKLLYHWESVETALLRLQRGGCQ